MKIEAGIPLPPRGKRQSSPIPWAELKVGESVSVDIVADHEPPWKWAARLRSQAWRHGKVLGKHFVVRLVTENDKTFIRVWRQEDGECK